MSRLLTIVAIAVLVLIFVLRWIPRIRSGGSNHSDKPRSPDTVICAECGTKYRPDTTGWICPKCGK
ncbi:MAG: hypothetical protein JXA30_09480 [Deltaproteobacteria bacterium]|nr:hypothetical protein [Deltaproteobacteria bacterium]